MCEAAEEFAPGKDTIYSLIRSGKLPAIDISNGRGERRRLVIDRAAMERFERERTAVPTASPPTAKRRPARWRESSNSFVDVAK